MGKVIEIKAEVTSDRLILSVLDEGPGIPSEILGLVFDKFYRGPGSPLGGVGLGLAIAKTIMEIHGGKIEVKNRRSGGAEFQLMLPIISPG